MNYLSQTLFDILAESSKDVESDLKKLKRFKKDSTEYKKFKRQILMKYHPDRGGSTEDSAYLNNLLDKLETAKSITDNRSLFTKVKEEFQDTGKAWKSDWKYSGKNDIIEVADRKALEKAITILKNTLINYQNINKKMPSFSLLQILEPGYDVFSPNQKLQMLLSRERPIRYLLKKIGTNEEDIKDIFDNLNKAAQDRPIKEEVLNEFIPLALPMVAGLAALPALILSGVGFKKLVEKIIIDQQAKKGMFPIYDGKKITGFAPKAEATARNIGSSALEKADMVKDVIASKTSEGFVSLKETLSPLGEMLNKTPEFIEGHIPETAAVLGGAALIIALAKTLIKKRKIKKFPNIEKKAKELNKKYKEPLDKKEKED